MISGIFEMTPRTSRNSSPRRFRRNRRRTGSLYPIVMGVSAIVTCLAVAGLEMSRVAGRANQQLRQQFDARRLAQAGLEYWQRQYNAQTLTDPEAAILVQVDANSGFYVTAKLSSAGSDSKGAAQLTSTGWFGNTKQCLTARFEARPTLYEGFRCALRSSQESIFHDDSTVSANHWSIAREDTRASSSQILMDAMTGDSFSGSASNYKQRRLDDIPWNMQAASLNPSNSSYPGKAYLNHPGAVTIRPPHGDDQLISNPWFATTVNPWYSKSPSIVSRDTTQGYYSPNSARVTNRTNWDQGPRIDITNDVVIGSTFQIDAWVRGPGRYILMIYYIYDSPFSEMGLTASPTNVTGTGWSRLSRTVTLPAPTRPPARIELGIINNNASDFNFDSVTMYNLSRDSDTVYIQNTVLSDTFNPFSVNNSNLSAAGIYVVDCRGREIEIENCRIRSTLVFINCDEVELRGGIAWEVPNRNYPAIIADAPITDKTTLSGLGTNSLRENEIKWNLNPSHTPYNGDSDTDFLDAYPCGIQGPMVSTDEILLGNSSSSRGKIRDLTGPILAREEIEFTETNKRIWFPSDMILNPPPGFFPSFTPMRMIPSSIDDASPHAGIEVRAGKLILDGGEVQQIEEESGSVSAKSLFEKRPS
jgi:hypothetical protein